MCFTRHYRNFILCGEADQHCLLCNETFHRIDDIEKHIRWEKHRKTIKTQTCMPKLKNDGIFKIGSFYYCQYCNNVTYNMAAAKEHVGTAEHISHKNYPEDITKKTEASYQAGDVIINKIKIDSLQWNGIYNKNCLLCNVVVKNVFMHIETQNHIIRLIQTETKYEGDDKCYRKANKGTFQCFTCYKTFPSQEFDTHWLSKDHSKEVIESKNINGETEKPIRIYDRSEYNKLSEELYDVRKLANIKDDYFSIDLINEEIICISCKMAVKNTKKDLSNHMFKKHKICDSSKSNIITQIADDIDKEYVYIYETDHGKARHDLAKYGKGNHIKLNAGGSKGYCILCDRFMSAHINIFKQHVEGSVHSGHLELKGEIKPKKHKKGEIKLETLSHYLSIIEFIPELQAIAVNMAFCIDKHSFFFIKQITHGQHFKKTKCFACDEMFEWSKEKEHCEGKTHKSNVIAAKVVLEENNFIREIRPKLYHCGLCNTTLPFWETLVNHLDDLSHKMKTHDKMYSIAIEEFKEEHEHLPITVKITHSTDSVVLYSNIMKASVEEKFYGIHLGFLKRA